MALNIFDNDTAKAADYDFSSDVVGKFRSGYLDDAKRPQSLDAFRVTTGDPEVAEAIQEALGGDEPQEWEAKGEDNLEVFTAANTVEIILDPSDGEPIRQKFVLRNPATGEVIRSGDGQVLDDGRPDPQAGQTYQERKQAARDGIGAKPETDIFFRLAGHEDLGKFQFHTASWDFASDLNFFSTLDKIQDIVEDNEGAKVKAVLGLEEVSFTAKSGPRKGKKVTYKKPTLKIVGVA